MYETIKQNLKWMSLSQGHQGRSKLSFLSGFHTPFPHWGSQPNTHIWVPSLMCVDSKHILVLGTSDNYWDSSIVTYTIVAMNFRFQTWKTRQTSPNADIPTNPSGPFDKQARTCNSPWGQIPSLKPSRRAMHTIIKTLCLYHSWPCFLFKEILFIQKK